MVENYARTDLALESCSAAGDRLEGVEQTVHRSAGCVIHRVSVVSSEAATVRGKPVGTYVTVECGQIHRLDRERLEALNFLLAGELRGMTRALTGRFPGGRLGVFVAGLGNAKLTADAVGPGTVNRLTATRHLLDHEAALFRALGCSALSALSPGVLGETGIETLELLRGAVRSVHPDLVIAVDALAARSCSRLASTVQISDSGIVPGSGVGNHRTAITAETLGVPVIAIGVPTVVDSSTLVWDALHQAHIEEVSEDLRAVLENGRSFFVSPKESDLISATVSELLAGAITEAFVGNLS